MYNSLVLAALLPLSGPTAGEQLVALSPPVRIESRTTDPGDRIPVITRVAYAPDGETADRTGNFPAVPQPAATPIVPPQPPKTSNAVPGTPPTFASTTSPPKVIEFRGQLKIPKQNTVVLSAPCQARLTSLKTARQGTDGQPVWVPLREGMHVVEGQLLGTFDTQLLETERAGALCKLKVAQAEAENVILLKAARDSVNAEQAELAIREDANSRHEGTVSVLEINRAKLKVEHAAANYQLEEYKLQVIKKEELNVHRQAVEAMDEMIRHRQLVSPISGMIVKISKAEGEWSREGDEVLEIWRLDTLNVVCKVNANLYDQNNVIGKAVSITAPLVDGKTEEFPGKVVFINPSINSDDTFDVHIDVQNRPSGNSWLLQPERMVFVTIKL